MKHIGNLREAQHRKVEQVGCNTVILPATGNPWRTWPGIIREFAVQKVIEIFLKQETQLKHIDSATDC